MWVSAPALVWTRGIVLRWTRALCGAATGRSIFRRRKVAGRGGVSFARTLLRPGLAMLLSGGWELDARFRVQPATSIMFGICLDVKGKISGDSGWQRKYRLGLGLWEKKNGKQRVSPQGRQDTKKARGGERYGENCLARRGTANGR